MNEFNEIKLKTYEILRKIFNKLIFLMYFHLNHNFFIDVNASKKYNIKIMIYHVKKNRKKRYRHIKISIIRIDVKLILFLNKCLFLIELKY